MTYQIDPQHTTVQFKVRHMMIANVRGVFGKFTGSVDFDPANLSTAKLEITIDAASLATTDPVRNEKLKGPEVFDVANHPNITFHSKSVAAAGPGAYTVTGNLSLHGVTKEIKMDVTGMTDEGADPWGNLRRGCEAHTRISRGEFGMGFNMPVNGGVLVSDEVDLHLDVELLRKP